MATDPVQRPRPVPDPELRLFVAHHAGGSHVPYRSWAAHLPSTWELCLLEAPGRNTRPGPLCTDARELAATFLEDVLPWTDRPYAVFGHSMGAVAAYEMALELTARNLPLPRWLGLSALNPPEHHPRPYARYDLPEAELREAVLAMGGTPREVLEHPEWWALLEPMLRADLRLAEAWQPRAAQPLTVPMSVFVAGADPVATPELADLWAARSTRFQRVHVLDGRHFYFQPDPALLIGRIVADILGAARPGHGPGLVTGQQAAGS